MKVTIIGTGYVGLVTGTCLAELGNKVYCVDVIKEKVKNINKGKSPIYEEGLETILKKNVKKKRLVATTDYSEALEDSDVSFVCVGTPSRKNGSIDLKYIKSASEEIGKCLKEMENYHVVTYRSTIVPGTTRSQIVILENESKKIAGDDFGVCMNPEHLAEGSAVKDFSTPDKIIIGQIDSRSGYILEKLYAPLRKQKVKIKDLVDPLILKQTKEEKKLNYNVELDVLKTCSLEEAEMEKYMSNAFLASKVSSANEMANICRSLRLDYFKIMELACMDRRLGSKFRKAGPGFGGSCFPKDVKALVAKAKSEGYNPKLLKEVLKINEMQPKYIVDLVEGFLGDVKNKKISILGTAFKGNSDDIRESRSLVVIDELLEKGGAVKVYDPKAMPNTKEVYGKRIKYAFSLENCVEGSDAVVLMTDWDELKKQEIFDNLEIPVIDARGVLSPTKKFGGVGRP